MDEAKELVPEGHWHVSFEERFALSTADPKSKSATVSKRLALEAYAKAERRRERFEGSGCVAQNRFREYEDPDSGEKYHIDRATGASVWAQTAEEHGEAPPVFTRELDEASGHYFFHNKGTGKSHWETPRWDLIASPKNAKDGDEETPQIWHEEYDDYHEQTYYVNSMTGESRWSKPEDMQ